MPLASKIGSKLTVVLNGVFMAVDLTTIIFNSRDIHKYRNLQQAGMQCHLRVLFSQKNE